MGYQQPIHALPNEEAPGFFAHVPFRCRIVRVMRRPEVAYALTFVPPSTCALLEGFFTHCKPGEMVPLGLGDLVHEGSVVRILFTDDYDSDVLPMILVEHVD